MNNEHLKIQNRVILENAFGIKIRSNIDDECNRYPFVFKKIEIPKYKLN